MSQVQPAVRISNLTISFRSYQQRPTTLKEAVLWRVRRGRRKYYSSFDALTSISFEVPRGSVFGIIGSNGAGKTTLLRAITGVLPPSTGTVKVHGRIDSLIQLGAGFDVELSAIENIYLNCSLHKMTRNYIKSRIPGILRFAELEDFAHTPIKYYSSGMFARLGFAVAVDRDPDILVVDEVLAVGDDRFREKCMNVFQDLLARQKTIIMVSHNLDQVQSFCKEAALLECGHLAYLGEPAQAIARYVDPSYKTRLHA